MENRYSSTRSDERDIIRKIKDNEPSQSQRTAESKTLYS